MTDLLKITIIQSPLVWEDPEANRRGFSEKILAITETTDLIVLPEMFTTGFTMNAVPLAEHEEGETLNWMREHARAKNAAVSGSIIISEPSIGTSNNETYYNRLFFVYPDGTYKTYNKRHTFTLAREHDTYASGKDRLIIALKGWKICPLICYDLRFPVWSRNLNDYDVLLYVANWPQRRIAAWDALLKARAIENMSYCVGVNRTGKDGNGHQYIGHSAVYNVLGEQISQKIFEEDFIETVTLEKEQLESARSHLQFLEDADKFNLM